MTLASLHWLTCDDCGKCEIVRNGQEEAVRVVQEEGWLTGVYRPNGDDLDYCADCRGNHE